MHTNIHTWFLTRFFFSFKLIAKYGSLNQKRKGKKWKQLSEKKELRGFLGIGWNWGNFLWNEWRIAFMYIFWVLLVFQFWEGWDREREKKKRGERIKNWQINLSCFYTKVESKPPSPSLLTANGNEKPQLSAEEKKSRTLCHQFYLCYISFGKK